MASAKACSMNAAARPLALVIDTATEAADIAVRAAAEIVAEMTAEVAAGVIAEVAARGGD